MISSNGRIPPSKIQLIHLIKEIQNLNLKKTNWVKICNSVSTTIFMNEIAK